MVNKLKPDVVMWSLFLDILNYGKMATKLHDINQNTSSKTIAAMSDDNQKRLTNIKINYTIIKTPKKGWYRFK